MQKLHVLIITGTRAEYGLYKSLIRALQRSRRFEPKFLVTGMHTLKSYGHTLREIRDDNMPIAAVVLIDESDDMLQAFAKEVSGIAAYCTKNVVDLMIVLGDRNEQLAGALTAIHNRIPVAHIAGGDTSGEGPDEFVRHAISKLSHVHFTASAKSAARVRALGEESWRIFMPGALGLDVLSTIKLTSQKDIALRFKLDASRKWLLVLHHPTPLDVTPMRDQIVPLMQALPIDAEKIVLYPNSDSGSDVFIREIERFKGKKYFHHFKNLPREEFLSLLNVCDALIGNSSAGIIESTYFRLPTINIGTRQQGREMPDNVIQCGYSERDIAIALKSALSSAFKRKTMRARSPYGSGQVSSRIVAVLEKFADRIRSGQVFFKKPVI